MTPAVSEREHRETEDAKARLRGSLSRADEAIRQAMAEADALFQPQRYRGPERRTKAR